MSTQTISHVLVSDLTGALLGHEDALEGFRQWFAQERWRIGLVYVTHRPTPHPKQVIEKFRLPTPDYLICALGIEMFDFALDDWVAPVRYENWNADQVRTILRTLPGTVTGVEGSRSPRCVSYQLRGNARDHLPEIERALAREQIDARLILEQSQLEIVPRAATQRAMMEHLAQSLRIPKQRLIACAGADSDPAIFAGPFAGVLVGNASVTLNSAPSEQVYRSPFSFADGVIDGVQSWRERWQGEPNRRG